MEINRRIILPICKQVFSVNLTDKSFAMKIIINICKPWKEKPDESQDSRWSYEVTGILDHSTNSSRSVHKRPRKTFREDYIIF